MRMGLICLLVGFLTIWGCSSDSNGTAGSGGAGGTAGIGGSGGGGGSGGTEFSWPPDATVYLDEHGIFHADCATDEDCVMALGYFHARDRFVKWISSAGSLPDASPAS